MVPLWIIMTTNGQQGSVEIVLFVLIQKMAKSLKKLISLQGHLHVKHLEILIYHVYMRPL